MKTCKWCHEAKPLELFHKHKWMADGHLNKCKSCTSAANSAYKKTERGKAQVKKNRVQYNDSKTKYKKSEKGKAAAARYQRPKDRMAAKNAVRYAISTGRLVRQPCLICGDKGVAHHSSYAPEMRLCVTWLCLSHHNQLHIEHEGKKVWTNP